MSHKLLGLLFVFLGFFASFVCSKTSKQDVAALNTMYTSLNSPSKLKGWESSGGDPCGDSWDGIKCQESSVTEIDISNLDLTGSLGYQLSNLKSLTKFDASQNNLNNQIPFQLPPNLVYLDFSENEFSGNVPYSLSQMNKIEYINLRRNQLNGELGDMFQKLKKLDSLDLSSNQLTGKLPHSFAKLASLTKLYLQDNQLTGSINVLRELPLEDLNIENNTFSGWIPNELKDINIYSGGNDWSDSPAPPPPPGQHFKRASKDDGSGDGAKQVVNGIMIAGICLGVLIFLAILIALFTRRKSIPSSHFIDEERGSRRAFTPLSLHEFSHERVELCEDFKDRKSADSNASIDVKSMQRSQSSGLKHSFSKRMSSLNDNQFANRLNAKRSTSMRSSEFGLSDLQTATANFATARLLGEGSIGRVYRAKYADGRVLAVKKIDSSFFQSGKTEDFSGLVTSISKIHHPNISELVGYCTEQGHNMLIYEYFRNGSLHEFLHLSDDFSRPLTWNTRIRIALGTARAMEYLHEVCSPSIIHKNIKSSNILLDAELNPRLADYGFSNFHHNNDHRVGYNAPECKEPSSYTQMSDVYSFGVVMLELLTGRMPYDSNKPKSEQTLVLWATPQLHDIDALANMVDPALRGLYPPKSLSRFADIIALCVQLEPEFRPPISEVVESLVRLVQRSNMDMREDLSTSRRTEDSDY